MSDNTTMDPRQLREETRREHEATEAMMPLTGAELTRELYVSTLGRLLPLVRSWEQWVFKAAPGTLQGLMLARQRSHLLRADLEQLHASVPPVDEEPVSWDAVVGIENLPVGSDEYRARLLGAIYVMEGSTLGGRYIAKHVETVLGFQPGQGDAYFQGHGSQTAPMWREVTSEIAAVPDVLAPVTVEVARRTFQAFGEALHTREVAPEMVHG